MSTSLTAELSTESIRPGRLPGGGYGALTATGLAVELRPYAASDAPAVRNLIAAASERSRYLRFFTASLASGDSYVDHLADPGQTLAAVVVVERGAIAAIGSLHPNTDGSASEAEFGLIVAEGRQGDGLGTLVLEDLLMRAWLSGMQSVVAMVMATNSSMLKVFQDSGFVTAQRFESGELSVRCSMDSVDQALARVADRQSRAEVASLDHVLRPASIAVVGAGHHRQTVGRQVLDNLVKAGFTGRLDAVNPRGSAVGSVPGHLRVGDIDGPLDLVVVAVNTATVLAIARDCAAAGARAMLILSAGFGESGADGSESQAELLRICRESGMRLIGPNCIGVANTDPAIRLNATFLPEPPASGATGILSQSGAATVALLDALRRRGAGVSALVTVGNKADVGGNDVLPWWRNDSRTRVIAAYLESIAEPLPFARLARSVSDTTPLVLLKAGRTPAAAAAASSHTAAAADDDAAVDALCRNANIVRVDNLRELADVSALAGMQPLPRGARVAIVGNSGGPAVLAADACAARGLQLARLSSRTQDRLRVLLPAAAAVGGPVDVTAAATPTQVERAMDLVAADPDVDVIIAVLTVLGHVPGPELAAALYRVDAAHPTTTIAACIFGDDVSHHGTVPRFDQPEDAIAAVAKLRAFVVARSSRPSAPEPAVRLSPVRGAVQDVLATSGPRWLTAAEGYRLLQQCGIAAPEFVMATDAESAATGSSALMFPVVVKAEGPDLVHKSDVTGVRLDRTGPEQVHDAVLDMQSRIGPAMTGVIVQTQVDSGFEIIIGVTRDARFGPLLMIGRGGVASDVDPDRRWAMAPVDQAAAEAMIRELRCLPLLKARRGRPPADISRLADIAVRVSRLISEVSEISEIDLNPVLARSDSAIVVDVRVRVCAAPRPALLDHVRHLR